MPAAGSGGPRGRGVTAPTRGLPPAASLEPALSIVVPLFNEEDSIGPLHEAIVRAVDSLGIECEMLFVDDGSDDATFRRAEAVGARDPRVRVV